MGDVIDGAQGVAQGVDRGAAGVAEGDAGVVAGQEELGQQGEAGVGSLVPDGQIALENPGNGLVAEELCGGAGLGGRLDSMAWIRASMELVAKTEKGRPFSSSGMRTA